MALLAARGLDGWRFTRRTAASASAGERWLAEMHEAAVNDLCAHGYGALTAKKVGAAHSGRSHLS